MEKQVHLHIPAKELAEFCHEHRIRSLALFGSALREDFTPESDIDLLVEFESEAHIGLITLGEIQYDLSRLLGRTVDLVLRSGLKRRIRDSILASAQVIHAN